MSNPITQDAVARVRRMIDQLTNLDTPEDAMVELPFGELRAATQSLSEWRDSPELVERVAKAIRHEDGGHIVPAELERYRRFARAALSALPPGSVKP